jgi:hypothetical protein
MGTFLFLSPGNNRNVPIFPKNIPIFLFLALTDIKGVGYIRREARGHYEHS